MSIKETERVGVCECVMRKTMTVKELAETLKVSYRQARRIAARYRAGGAPALAHQSRGRPSPLRIAEAEKRRMVTRADRNGVNMPTLDRALWQYSKENKKR